MVTHDGNLFLVQAPKAHPPSPFLSDEDEASPEAHTPLKDREVTRGVSQIMDAFGVADLRSILVVRRANAPVPANQHTERAPNSDQDWANVWTVHADPPEEGDYDDEGGEESLNKHEDKQHLRMRRSFELLLTSGHVIRFEVGFILIGSTLLGPRFTYYSCHSVTLARTPWNGSSDFAR